MPDLTRVVVVGTSCSGKTTFARSLAEELGSPHVELDALHWGPNWSMRADFAERVAAAAAQPSWVMDGNYSKIRSILWPRATAIVWPNYSFALTFGRALRRTATRIITRERLWWDNRETVRNALFDREGVLWWILRTYRRRRREYRELMRAPEYAHVDFLEMPSPAAAEAFLGGLRAARTPRSAR
jgi:adenylate kinase family enzyme